MDAKFPWISNQPRERIKEKVSASVREVFRHTSVVVRKRERGLNCINYRAACIFAPPPRYANIVSPCPPCLRCRGPLLRPTKSQISYFVFAPLALNLSFRLPRVTHGVTAGSLPRRSILTVNVLLLLMIVIFSLLARAFVSAQDFLGLFDVLEIPRTRQRCAMHK